MTGRPCRQCGEPIPRERLRQSICSDACREARNAAAWLRRDEGRRRKRLQEKQADPRPCARCGATIPADRNTTCKYCSRQCREAMYYTPVVRTQRSCRQCKAPLPKNAHVHRRYCNAECKMASVRKSPETWRVAQCPQCGTTLPAKRPANMRYCSSGCRREGTAELKAAEYQRRMERRRAEVGQRFCLACDKPIPDEAPPHRKYCSRQCAVNTYNRKPRPPRERRAKPAAVTASPKPVQPLTVGATIVPTQPFVGVMDGRERKFGIFMRLTFIGTANGRLVFANKGDGATITVAESEAGKFRRPIL
jgi:predicted nucleic acid-binding Zn ribbon protein